MFLTLNQASILPINVFDHISLFHPQKLSIQIDENALHEILNEVDLNKNGQVELDEFLQVRLYMERARTRCSKIILTEAHLVSYSIYRP